MRTMDVCITFLIEATELSIETTWKLLYIICVYLSSMYELTLRLKETHDKQEPNELSFN